MADGSLRDFTESHYMEVLRVAAGRFDFEPFGTTSAEPHVLWRHDLDFSVHRAVRLAEIEASLGVRSTYFFMLTSDFYNLLEADVLARARAIADLGHWCGLHYDVGAPVGPGSLDDRAAWQRGILETMLDRSVQAVSFHNPTVAGFDVDATTVGGMVSAYGAEVRATYRYISDSNGFWRFDRLADVVASDEPRVHVLTHPAWWQRDPMPPRSRVVRCIDGRAGAAIRRYDQLLATNGRTNLGLPDVGESSVQSGEVE
jgi:hypothetical protein